MNASNPIKKGKIIIINPKLGFIPSIFIFCGSLAISVNNPGSAAVLTAYTISNGTAPIVFVASITATNIIIYLQAEFFPKKDDLRWFIIIKATKAD
jgi:hypothetical protein